MYKSCKYLFFIFLLVGSFGNLFSQEVSQENKDLANEYIKQADDIMNATPALDLARDLYELAAQTDPNNIVANYKAGEFRLLTVGKDRAVNYFLKVLDIDKNYRFNITYLIGRSYQYGMQFDKALAYYNRYKNQLESQPGYRGRDRTELPDVERRMYECQNAIEFVANPAHYSIVNIGEAVNSDYDDFGPVVNEDETLMVFTTRRRDGNINQNVFSDNKPYEEIFFSEKVNGVWQPAQNIGEVVNTEFHSSTLALSADGQTLFIYQDDNNGDIFESTRKEDESWTFPQSMSENINSEGFKESSISISPDETILFFASDRPGGEGGIDIYYSVKDRDGEWGRSKNLGPRINTEFDDDGPFIDYDGKTLYFSTQGRKGMGGYDIFKSEYDSANNEWTEPENLGFPINTPDDDIYFVSTPDGKRGYYASVREDGMGFTDIYQVTILQDDESGETIDARTAEHVDNHEDVEAHKGEIKGVDINTDPVVAQVDENADNQQTDSDSNTISDSNNDGNITDTEQTDEDIYPVVETSPVSIIATVVDSDGKPLDAKITLTSKATNRVAGKRSSGSGEYTFTVKESQASDYRLSVEKAGYAFQNLDMRIPAATEQAQVISKKITLSKLVVGTRRVLRNIYFKFNKASFKDDSFPELNKLESMMSQNAGMNIELSGHTDNVGSKPYNKRLSQKRANAVKDYLVNKGIDARRIVAVGYGEERPMASNDDEREGRELNRRVEFKVIR